MAIGSFSHNTGSGLAGIFAEVYLVEVKLEIGVQTSFLANFVSLANTFWIGSKASVGARRAIT
jgi:hypothetical protein